MYKDEGSGSALIDGPNKHVEALSSHNSPTLG